jgi:hypothetical protein
VDDVTQMAIVRQGLDEVVVDPAKRIQLAGLNRILWGGCDLENARESGARMVTHAAYGFANERRKVTMVAPRLISGPLFFVMRRRLIKGDTNVTRSLLDSPTTPHPANGLCSRESFRLDSS